MAAKTDVNTVIDRNLTKLDKPGVLSVRPGFRVRKGRLTGQRAIVVTVHQKVASPPRGTMLPSSIGGVPVDVRQASKEKREEIESPDAFSARMRLTPDTGSVPHFRDERTPSGAHPTRAASAHARLAAIHKAHLGYTPPPASPLVPFEGEVKIRLSASPDNGWGTLSNFLAATSSTLTVGLYDFTARHIEEAVAAATAGKRLKLVLDHPATNPTADQTDEQTVSELGTDLGAGLDQAWALTKMDPHATAWIYPTAYHIKVAVRDGTSFWLSSGNWNNSNQPDIDPSADAADAEQARTRDRDWHVVIENTPLSEQFERYILNDLAVAMANNKGGAATGPPLTPPTGEATKTKPFKKFFPAKDIEGRARITPLLTPDPGVYTSAVKDLIDRAEKTLYMQYQYIEPPREGSSGSQAFVALIDAVIARQHAGIDVRIILSEFEKVGYLEQLQGLGLDIAAGVRLQNNVHNKGIVVDAKEVLVSSQNWSSEGTLENRDAGVIIEQPEAAAYFQEIFLHDWQNLAHQRVTED
jgi:hypothetical protein